MNLVLEHLIHEALVTELVLWLILFCVEMCLLHLLGQFQPPVLVCLSAGPNSSLADLQKSPAFDSKLPPQLGLNHTNAPAVACCELSERSSSWLSICKETAYKTFFSCSY